MLISLKLFPSPALAMKSNYACLFDDALCTQCGICAKRCTVGTFKMKDEKIEFHADRCIGCGLCVTTCPTEALELHKKPEESMYTPPPTVYDTYAVMSREKVR